MGPIWVVDVLRYDALKSEPPRVLKDDAATAAQMLDVAEPVTRRLQQSSKALLAFKQRLRPIVSAVQLQEARPADGPRGPGCAP